MWELKVDNVQKIIVYDIKNYNPVNLGLDTRSRIQCENRFSRLIMKTYLTELQM